MTRSDRTERAAAALINGASHHQLSALVRLAKPDNGRVGPAPRHSSQATYLPEIHPKIVWAKFESLAEGARRATDRLW